MTAKRKSPLPAGRLLGGLLLLVLLLVVVGLLIVDYRAALALVAGAALAFVLRRVFVGVRSRIRRSSHPRRWTLIGGALLLSVPICVILILMFDQQRMGELPADVESPGAQGLPQPVALIEAYSADIRAGERPVQGVVVAETVIYDVRVGEDVLHDDLSINFPERRISSTNRGFLLREVTVVPLDMDIGATGTFTITTPEGLALDARLCGRDCPRADVRLSGYPKGTFYDARDAETIEQTTYLNEAIVRWEPAPLRDGITFAYIPPPFHTLRPLLAPFVGASSASEWVVGLAGMLGSMLSMPVLGSVLESLAEDWLGGRIADWITDRRKRKPDKS